MITDSTIDVLALRYLELQTKITELNQEVKALSKEQVDISDKLINTVRDLGLKTAKTNQVSVVLTTSEFPNVEDWQKVYTFILENEMPFLLQKRLVATGYQALKAEGVEVPGVKVFEKTSISVKRVTKK